MEVETIALELIEMEYEKISSNKEKFMELDEKNDEVKRDWLCNNSKILELEYEQNSLIDSNPISRDIIDFLSSILPWLFSVVLNSY